MRGKGTKLYPFITFVIHNGIMGSMIRISTNFKFCCISSQLRGGHPSALEKGRDFYPLICLSLERIKTMHWHCCIFAARRNMASYPSTQFGHPYQITATPGGIGTRIYSSTIYLSAFAIIILLYNGLFVLFVILWQ